MAEAIAAIGLASSIVSFIDIGTKFVSQLQAFNESRDQVPVCLVDVAAQLPLLVELTSQIQTDSVLDGSELSRSSSQTLLQAINGCTRRTRELATLIELTTISPTDSRVVRLRKTWISIRQERKILDILRSLETYKSLITLKLLQDRSRMLPDEDKNAEGTSYIVPSLKIVRFVGRVDILVAIGENLETHGEGRKIVVLVGMGGMGKTQIALEYCSRVWSNGCFQNIFWIDASSLESIERSYETVAAALAGSSNITKGLKSTALFVKESIERLRTAWLMVYDNFDSPRKVPNIQELLPNVGNETHGAILFTSRHVDSARLGTMIQVNQMGESDCLEVFFRHTQYERSKSNNTLASKIIDRLGNLPLAIDQAAAYIKSRQLKLNQFDEKYAELSATSLWRTLPQVWEYKKQLANEERQTALSVCTTWDMSFQELSGDPAYQSSVGTLLSCLALFGRSNMSEKLAIAIIKDDEQFTRRLDICLTDGLWDRHKFQDTLVELYGLSILQSINLDSEFSSFTLHPMICEWLKLRIDVKERRRFVGVAASSLNQLLTKQLNSLEATLLEDAQQLLGYIDNLTSSARELIPEDTESSAIPTQASVTFARYYCHFEKFDRAEELHRAVLAVYDRTLEPDDIAKLELYHDLGLCYFKQGKYSEAEALYEKAIKGKAAKLGPEHPSTLRSMKMLGTTNRRSLNYTGCEKMLLYVAEVASRTLGLHDILYLETLNNLAVLRRYQKRLMEAQQLAEESLALKLQTIGFLHVSTLTTYRCVALILKDQGKHAEAEDKFLRSLEGLRKVVGSLHTSTLFTVSLLEQLYSTMGLEEKAVGMGEMMHGEMGRCLLRASRWSMDL
jgi:tetratricopeptide (TPR) repeat protein